MPTYILLTKLPSKMFGEPPKNRENIGREWFGAVKEKCPEAKWLTHYALIGPYDFMDIYEAPNEEAAAKVSLITMTHGAVEAETWTALPYQRFVEITKKL